MKTYKKSYLLLISFFAAVLLTACEEEALEPELNVTATPATVNAGEEVNFEITGSGETFVIYPGDAGHNFDSSYLAIAEGMDIDLESIVLTSEGLTSLLPWLEGRVDTYNATAETPVSFDAMATKLDAFVGKNYEYAETAKYEIADQVMPELPTVAVELVDNYFQDNSEILAPEGGYHTGVALNRYELDFSYAYDTPGVYTATVIATNVSNKNYSGSGYQFDRTASASEYDFNRNIKQITITVQ